MIWLCRHGKVRSEGMDERQMRRLETEQIAAEGSPVSDGNAKSPEEPQQHQSEQFADELVKGKRRNVAWHMIKQVCKPAAKGTYEQV